MQRRKKEREKRKVEEKEKMEEEKKKQKHDREEVAADEATWGRGRKGVITLLLGLFWP